MAFGSNPPPTTSRSKTYKCIFNKDTGHIKDIFMSVIDPLLEELKANREELKANREGEKNKAISNIYKKG